MFYRVHTAITPWSLRIDSNGDNLASFKRIEDLARLGLPNTPPVNLGRDDDGNFNIFRDFDTQEQADQWLQWYQVQHSFVSGSVEQVEEKIVGTYSDAYLALTQEQQLLAWEDCQDAQQSGWKLIP